jgi:hypothetical protein
MKPPVLVTIITWSQPNSRYGFKFGPLLKTHASPGG